MGSDAEKGIYREFRPKTVSRTMLCCVSVFLILMTFRLADCEESAPGALGLWICELPATSEARKRPQAQEMNMGPCCQRYESQHRLPSFNHNIDFVTTSCPECLPSSRLRSHQLDLRPPVCRAFMYSKSLSDLSWRVPRVSDFKAAAFGRELDVKHT